MSPDVKKKMDEFRNSTDAPAFECIGNNFTAKKAFADALEDRYKAPNEIDQGGSSLCAAASFMYCIAREKPDEYAKYVLDLAMKGVAHLGTMKVAPKKALNGYVSKGWRTISPVDWVALASVRDSFFSPMSGVDSDFGGMTAGSTLKDWFDATGWFSSVQDVTSIANPRTMNHLLRINTLPTSYVCLLTKGRAIKANLSSPWHGADHWAVLGDANRNPSLGSTNGLNGHTIWIQFQCADLGIQINEAPVPFLGGDVPTWEGISSVGDNPHMTVGGNGGKKNVRYNELESGKLDFKVYTWGGETGWNGIKGIQMVNLTVKEFLINYFGYVAAQWK
jgi:hypothetical protein